MASFVLVLGRYKNIKGIKNCIKGIEATTGRGFHKQVSRGKKICWSQKEIQRQSLVLSFSPSSSFSSSSILGKEMTTLRHLNQTEAVNIDLELFDDYAFSVDQLMELAGQACADAIYKEYYKGQEDIHVLVCCGPGNNGGDGMVMARHLKSYGFRPQVLYPKRTDKTLYKNLLLQCQKSGIKVMDETPEREEELGQFGLIVDALFGFSFRPPVRKEFVGLMDLLRKTKIPLVSVDVPSGWDVEKGDVNGEGLAPDMLVCCLPV